MPGSAQARQTAPPARGEVSRERRAGPAFGAALRVRLVAGEPEELELEGECERVLRGPRGPRLERVAGVEEPRDRLERPRVRLLLGEETQHRLGADEPDREPVVDLARRGVRAHEMHTRHRLELARALVQHHLDVGQRLEPRAEPGLRAPDPLRDRADATLLAGCRGGGPGRPRRAGRSAGRRLRSSYVLPATAPVYEPRAAPGTKSDASPLQARMPRIQMYSTAWCGYCVRAKALLEGKGLEYEELTLEEDPTSARRLFDLTGGWTVPQIVIDGSRSAATPSSGGSTAPASSTSSSPPSDAAVAGSGGSTTSPGRRRRCARSGCRSARRARRAGRRP